MLNITHGLHQGVQLSLDRSVYRVGSAASSDLLLSDAGIAERHMVLRFANGQVAVEAIGADVVVYGAHAREIKIPAGRGHRARLPLDIRIGDARLTLSSTTDSVQHAAPTRAAAPVWLRKPQWILALLLMFLCVGAFAFRDEAVSPLAIADKSAPSLPERRQQQVATAAQAKVWLEEQLATSSLKQIKVSEVDGQLGVQGFYDPAQKGQWRSVQQAFDSRFGQQVVMHPDVLARTEIAKPRVRFQAVWFGANPYVINDSGKRLYPGASLADDWTLESIENNQVILARGEERFTFTL